MIGRTTNYFTACKTIAAVLTIIVALALSLIARKGFVNRTTVELCSIRKGSAYYDSRTNRANAVAHRNAYEQVVKMLRSADTQQEYNKLIPAFCEFATRNMVIGRGCDTFYDDCTLVRSNLALLPALQILQGTNGVQRGTAAMLCAVLGQSEATPLLIDAMNSRFAGGELPCHLSKILNTTFPIKALAILASKGDKSAESFLRTHTTIESWHDIRFLIPGYSHADTVSYLRGVVIEALIFMPSQESIRQIQSSGYDPMYEPTLCNVIQNFMGSGDTLDTYHRELFCHDPATNKYFVAPYILNPRVLATPRAK